MTQQRWKASLYIYIYIYIYVCVCVCVCEYIIIYTLDEQDRQDWKPAYTAIFLSLGLISSISPWARTWIFIVNTLWIIVISWLLCWFCTSSDRRVWFHFTNICCKIAQVIWQLCAKKSTAPVIPLACTSHSFCSIFWLCQVLLSLNPNCRQLQLLVHLQLIHRHRMNILGHRRCPTTNCYRWHEILLTVSHHLSMQLSTVTISKQTHLLTQ